MFHQSGGCCDGSSPMCYPDGDFIVGDRDVLLGVLDVGDDGVPVWISGPQFEAWKHTQLVIDVVPGRGGGFSLEAPEGMRFLSRGRAFTDDENRALGDSPPVTGAGYEGGARPARGGHARRRRGRRCLPDTGHAAPLQRLRLPRRYRRRRDPATAGVDAGQCDAGRSGGRAGRRDRGDDAG